MISVHTLLGPSGLCAACRRRVAKTDVTFVDLIEESIHGAESTQSTNLREFGESADAVEEISA